LISATEQAGLRPLISATEQAGLRERRRRRAADVRRPDEPSGKLC
jgi:hypothetical protein